MSVDINISIQPKNIKTVSAYNKWLASWLESDAVIDSFEQVAKDLHSFFNDVKSIIPILMIEPDFREVETEESSFGGQYFFYPEVLSICLKGSSDISDKEFDDKMGELDKLVERYQLAIECDGQVSGMDLIDDSADEEKKVRDREKEKTERYIGAMPAVANDVLSFFHDKDPNIDSLVVQLVRKDAVYLELRIRICCPDEQFQKAYSIFHSSVGEITKIVKKHTKYKFDFQMDRASTNSKRIHILWSSEKGTFWENLTSFFK